MKFLTKHIAKINVLKVEERMDRQTGRQALDKDNQPLWTVTVQEDQFNEEFNITERNIVKYKTLEELELGEHIVELKMTSMGEGSGSFVKVNTFFTIIRKIDEKVSLKDLFSVTKADIPPSKRKAAALASQPTQ